MKKMFIILIILVSCNTKYNKTKYEILVLLDDAKYEYQINYTNNWRVNVINDKIKDMLISSINDDNEGYFDKLPNGNFIFPDFQITKRGFDGVIEIFILNKNSLVYEYLLKSSKNSNYKIISEEFLKKINNETYISSKDIYNFKNNILSEVVFNISEDKIILFRLNGVMFSETFSYGDDNTENKNYNNYKRKDRIEILKEFCEIINSFTRKNILKN